MNINGRKAKRNLEIAIRAVTELYGDVFHEWNTKKANEFLKLSGISKRNWSIFMRHAGLADGERWTLRRLAESEGDISHVRVWQIVQQTRKNLMKFVELYCQGTKE